MPATQIPQSSTVTLDAPALRLDQVTTDEVIFIGPGISLTEAPGTLPYTITGSPTGWIVTLVSAVTTESATFSVKPASAATVSENGGYNLTYFDASGTLYSVWFDVILSSAVPTAEVPQKLVQGQQSALTIPLEALSYRGTFISVESPSAGTWLDSGAQTPFPYTATFNEAPAPTGWGVTLVSLESAVAYQSLITIPETFALGIYTITVSDGVGKIYEREFEVIPALPSGISTVTRPSCYTGFDMVSEVQVRLREALSTTAQQQSMLYERHVRRTLDEVARRTFTISDTVVADLIAGQIEYPLPKRPFEIRTISINDGYGNIRDIAVLTPEQAGYQFPFWQNTQSGSSQIYSGIPGYCVDEVTRLWLLPVPSYNQQAGLIMRGSVGVGQWYTLDMCLPMGEGFDEVVMMGTAYRRCEEMAPHSDLYRMMLPDYKGRFEDLIKRHYRERINHTAATRNQIPSRGRYWAGGWNFAGWGGS